MTDHIPPPAERLREIARDDHPHTHSNATHTWQDDCVHCRLDAIACEMESDAVLLNTYREAIRAEGEGIDRPIAVKRLGKYLSWRFGSDDSIPHRASAGAWEVEARKALHVASGLIGYGGVKP